MLDRGTPPRRKCLRFCSVFGILKLWDGKALRRSIKGTDAMRRQVELLKKISVCQPRATEPEASRPDVHADSDPLAMHSSKCGMALRLFVHVSQENVSEADHEPSGHGAGSGQQSGEDRQANLTDNTEVFFRTMKDVWLEGSSSMAQRQPWRSERKHFELRLGRRRRIRALRWLTDFQRSTKLLLPVSAALLLILIFTMVRKANSNDTRAWGLTSYDVATRSDSQQNLSITASLNHLRRCVPPASTQHKRDEEIAVFRHRASWLKRQLPEAVNGKGSGSWADDPQFPLSQSISMDRQIRLNLPIAHSITVIEEDPHTVTADKLASNGTNGLPELPIPPVSTQHSHAADYFTGGKTDHDIILEALVKKSFIKRFIAEDVPAQTRLCVPLDYNYGDIHAEEMLWSSVRSWPSGRLRTRRSARNAEMGRATALERKKRKVSDDSSDDGEDGDGKAGADDSSGENVDSDEDVTVHVTKYLAYARALALLGDYQMLNTYMGTTVEDDRDTAKRRCIGPRRKYLEHRGRSSCAATRGLPELGG
ncbi:uncharacterized protein C8Q71DRAFT_727145 [Rhodofomes roseus]|uniref:Transmembrane protein n=1 Tax=Rhodofomes roseus TaxID=34475 RepID=A0ABQ8K3L6_9APHY|nr:uncharacterized protein C8Q71DRAFT_727145 [Rhodofomes roseus]KAH9830954.1 hypothetical protein C8Q71DRAFT_727145 [Rhodofomes roseus]